MASSLIAFLQSFSPIPPADQPLIQVAWQARSIKEGDVLFQSGRVCQQLFFIEKGVLRIRVLQPSGKEVTHYFLKENQFCTIMQSFVHQTLAQESIQAACDGYVLAIHKDKLDTLYHQLPYLNTLINQIIQQGLMDKIQLRNAYLGLDSTKRYELFQTRQADIAARVSLSDIASYLEITPQSLSRIRKNRSH